MKRFIASAALLMIAAPAMACTDFTGTYRVETCNNDGDVGELVIQQKGCEQIQMEAEEGFVEIGKNKTTVRDGYVLRVTYNWNEKQEALLVNSEFGNFHQIITRGKSEITLTENKFLDYVTESENVVTGEKTKIICQYIRKEF